MSVAIVNKMLYNAFIKLKGEKSMLLELFGYLGSILVVVSLMMSSVVKLRIFNTVGSVISAAYALIIHSYPLALMNFCIIFINAYNLFKLTGSAKHYDIIDGREDDTYLTYFLNYYKKDIAEFFPNESGEYSGNAVYIVCCDASPVGLLMGNLSPDGNLDAALDYAVPTYRDCSIGKFLYKELEKKGVKKITCRSYDEKHEPYMKKMGFANKNGIYEKVI